MPAVRVGDVDLFYEEKGSGEPVVLVHGIPTDYRAWASQVGPLSAEYRTLAVSRRYATPNSRKGDLRDSTVQNNAVDLLELMGRLSVAPVHLVGHSYGGYISALIAEEHPELVRSLVLVEPAVPTMLVSDPESQGQMVALLFKSPSVALAARRFQTRSLRPSIRSLDGGDIQKAVELIVDGLQDSQGAFHRLPEETKGMMLENGRTVGELRTQFPKFTAAEAGRIECRTLIISGESSPLWLRRIAGLLGSSIPKAQLETIPGTAHFPHLENPREFNRRLLMFLGEGRKPA